MNFKCFGVLMLLAFLSFGIVACNGEDPEEEPFEHAGEYEIDIEDLGMPLIVYLRIEEDGTFTFASDSEFEDTRNTGEVRETDDEEYMMVYDEGTHEDPVTSTFVVEDGNLRFTSTMPYGEANIMYEHECDIDPDVTHHLMAIMIRYEEYLGHYGGSHTVEAMGGEIEYHYAIELMTGGVYSFRSLFVMGGAAHSYEEVGDYTIDEDAGTIELDPEDEDPVEGSIEEDEIEVPIQASDMASRETQTLETTTSSEYAGVYHAAAYREMEGTVMYDTTATLIMGHFNDYIYVAENVAEDEEDIIHEEGTYSVEDGEISYETDEDELEFSGDYTQYAVSGEFLLSSQVDMRSEETFYSEHVQGEFKASGELDDVEHHVTLELEGDGTFALAIIDEADEVFHEEDGDFEIDGNELVLNDIHTGMISETGLNMTFNIDDEEYGFGLTK